VASKPFAVCYGFRDELAIVYAKNAKDAQRQVEAHLASIGYSEETIEGAGICVSATRIEDVK
jgi:hypothetical protein